MAYNFDKAFEDIPFSAIATAPTNNGTAAPRDSLPRAGFEQGFSPAQAGSSLRNAVATAPKSDGIAAFRSPLSRAGSEQRFSTTQPRSYLARQDSETSVTSPNALPPGSPSYVPEKQFQLADFFPDQGEPRTAYSDPDIHEISRCLKLRNEQRWSAAPRLYIVLRTIGLLDVLNPLLDEGISDVLFPFTPTSVPKLISSDQRNAFLKAQQLVLTKAVELEKGLKRHTHFGKDDAFPFEIRGKLGRGGSASVDKIFNPFSQREFARKRFRRGSRGQNKDEVDDFKNELQVLKKVQHDHCIKLVSRPQPLYHSIITENDTGGELYGFEILWFDYVADCGLQFSRILCSDTGRPYETGHTSKLLWLSCICSTIPSQIFDSSQGH